MSDKIIDLIVFIAGMIIIMLGVSMIIG